MHPLPHAIACTRLFAPGGQGAPQADTGDDASCVHIDEEDLIAAGRGEVHRQAIAVEGKLSDRSIARERQIKLRQRRLAHGARPPGIGGPDAGRLIENGCQDKDEAADEQDAHYDDRNLEPAHLARGKDRSGQGLGCGALVHHRLSPPMTPEPRERHVFSADEEDAGERLDRFLAARLPALSRSRIKTLIAQGQASADGRTIVEPKTRVKPGLRYAIAVPAAEPAVPEPEPIPLAVVYEDDQLIVIDKPAGLVVHPAAGNWSGTLVNALLAHCGASLSGIGGVRRPGIVHRLDKDTSGLMVVAKTDAAHRALARQFADHGRAGPLQRRYRALVWGEPKPRHGRIATRIGRKPAARQKMAVVGTGGKEAVTHYEVLASYGGGGDALASLVECRLETGRTHQIRVHMGHIGHPLLGDATYGGGFKSKAQRLPPRARLALQALGRQALHASHLAFEHPTRGERLAFESPLPAAMADLVKSLSSS